MFQKGYYLINNERIFLCFTYCYFFQSIVIVKHPLSSGSFFLAAIFCAKVMGYHGDLYILFLLRENSLKLVLVYSV